MLAHPVTLREDYVVSTPVRVGDGRERVYNRPATTWDFGLGYSFRTNKLFHHQLRLNVKNVFNERCSYGADIAGHPRMILGQYAVKF